LPENVVKVIDNLPYLNDNLFKQNKPLKIKDELLQETLNFFEKYNFTIKEADSKTTINPQIIGYIHESMANVAEEIYDRNDLGIFYTPRIEVDFMCRRSLVEYLSKQLPDIPKDKFYYLLFGTENERKTVGEWFDKEGLWYKLEEVLDNLSAIDPACGSGAFLIGLLNILTEIYKFIYNYITGLSDFEIKSKIIQHSLYGVDVMPWAIHVTELRLWLQLIAETDFKENKLREHPLLPDLDHLRIGDSLLQEIENPRNEDGFDIVIGNPPYVRQEMISPPNRIKAEVTLEDRREYKEKLIQSVKARFPVVKKIDKRSDYYIYFYFHGLGLLNSKGTFLFYYF